MQIDYSVYDEPAIYRQQPDWALPPAKLDTLEVRGSTENVIYDMHPGFGTFCTPEARNIVVPDEYTELDAICAWALGCLKQGDFDRKPDNGNSYPCFTATAFTLFDTDGASRAEFDGSIWVTAPAEDQRDDMKARIKQLEADYWQNLRADNHATMRQISTEVDRLRRLLAMPAA